MATDYQNQIEVLTKSLKTLQDKYLELERNYQKHQHDGVDGTNVLRKRIKLDTDQMLEVGYGGIGTSKSSAGQYQLASSVGPDDQRTGFVNKANLAQTDILYTPTSFAGFIGRYGIVVTAMENTSLSISAAGSTVTITGYNFVTNELAGSVINIYNSSGTIIANRIIDSNTATVVTIVGNWGATASSCKFDIYKPMYSGSAQYIWQRYYTQEGTDGGIRFGMGVTPSTWSASVSYSTGNIVFSGGVTYRSIQDSNINNTPASSPTSWTVITSAQNGLLYMDSVGDLYWRDKAGASTKIVIPAGLSGTKVYYVSDSSGGAVTRKLTFTDGILTAEI